VPVPRRVPVAEPVAVAVPVARRVAEPVRKAGESGALPITRERTI
jgi:hypothetical protein